MSVAYKAFMRTLVVHSLIYVLRLTIVSVASDGLLPRFALRNDKTETKPVEELVRQKKMSQLRVWRWDLMASRAARNRFLLTAQMLGNGRPKFQTRLRRKTKKSGLTKVRTENNAQGILDDCGG